MFYHIVLRVNGHYYLRQVGGFLRILRFPPPIKLNTPRYNWNIVESGVKHHQTNKQIILPWACIKSLYYTNNEIVLLFLLALYYKIKIYIVN